MAKIRYLELGFFVVGETDATFEKVVALDNLHQGILSQEQFKKLGVALAAELEKITQQDIRILEMVE